MDLFASETDCSSNIQTFSQVIVVHKMLISVKGVQLQQITKACINFG